MAHRKKDEVLRTGDVTVEVGGKVYTATCEYLKGGFVRLQTGQGAHLRGHTEEQMARLLLHEIIASGFADRAGLGRPKPS